MLVIFFQRFLAVEPDMQAINFNIFTVCRKEKVVEGRREGNETNEQL